MNRLNREEYLADLEWLKEAAEELLDEYLAGQLGKPCRVLLEIVKHIKEMMFR